VITAALSSSSKVRSSNLRTRCVELLTSVVPRVLNLAKVTVRDLQLAFLIQRRKCTTIEKSILLLQLLELARNAGVVLIVCGQMHTLLYDNPDGVMLQVEQVLHVQDHRSHANAKVRVLKVRHSPKALLLTQRGECDVSRLLDSSVGLAIDDGPHPQILLVEGYRRTSLAYVQTIGHRQAAAVDRDIPIVAETKECVVEHSWEPRPVLARGTKSPILDEEEVGIFIHVHLKTQPQNVTNPK
jgi:hypothetical protein